MTQTGTEEAREYCPACPEHLQSGLLQHGSPKPPERSSRLTHRDKCQVLSRQDCNLQSPLVLPQVPQPRETKHESRKEQLCSVHMIDLLNLKPYGIKVYLP
jgi:hypothetical protein